MLRRRFLKWCLGLVCGAAAAKSPQAGAVQPSHYYDWKEEFTTDPRWEDCLPYGKVCHVILDGEDVSQRMITRVMTGTGGWFEEQLRDADGNWLMEIRDLWNERWVPLAECECKTWNVTRYDKSGNPEPHYGEERIVKRLVHGDVRFWVDPDLVPGCEAPEA